ncbi:dTDP-glucose 4,6-dehydratase [Alkalihalobacillus xiaoxiensis]|uniref:dTDP-glucose 4,6-dehydratase n=1 Tax=Shouchella xiaoxiensis TaxID=766895 RepID=A0ABS2SXR0_9BACI|nr:dTDP-glucose 4,6-dehydratase [Shouchella xiaoxiensis]MBM7839986.1 dTDP-glucose 4,6-dehydratase [Shouchella xiaoxiensis]
MKLLITGGAGFIGSAFVRFLAKRHSEDDLYVLDKLTYAGNLENLNSVPAYTFIHGDICDESLVKSTLADYKIEAIIHFAAESHVDRSINGADVFVKTNVVGTQTLLNAAKEHGIHKFIQVSTDEVYGSLGTSGYFTELSPLAPNSPYSASKAGADLLARAYHETYGLDVNITRCSNNYGPYHFPEKLIPLMITNALQNKTLPVYGDGLHVRDWLHVDDHCKAINLVLRKGKPGEVYNIGGQNERTNIEIVERIVQTLGVSKSLIQFVGDRLGHDRRYAIDASKIESELGWKADYAFEEGIVEVIDWYIQEKEWWQRVLSGEYRRRAE